MTAWPRLDYLSEAAFYATLHNYLQLVGKLPTRLHPWVNHGWHVTLRVTPHGFATRTVPAGERKFAVEVDLKEEALRITCDTGATAVIPLTGQTVAQLHGELSHALGSLGLPAPLHGGPNEVEHSVPFVEDQRERPWDGEVLRRLHGALLAADRTFQHFRALYRGKSSPSHLFWGSFDLAVTRFSGREAPRHPGGIPNLPDAVTREAYSHEVVSAGFWPGGGGVEEAAFYAYSYPVPDVLAEQPIAPVEAAWNAQLGEFVLPYRAVAEAADPESVLLEFLQSTFDAAASLLDWPDGLTVGAATTGHPPPADR